MPQITHVIWDLDGTLLDTEPSYLISGTEIARKYGRELTPAIREQMMGRPGLVAARIFLDALEIDVITPEQFIEERETMLEALFRACQPMPGALALSRHLHAHGIPQAVATSSSRRNVGFKTVSHTDWFGTFGAVVTSEDVEHGKPAPDIFLHAASLIDAPPASTLVFEDSPSLHFGSGAQSKREALLELAGLVMLLGAVNRDRVGFVHAAPGGTLFREPVRGRGRILHLAASQIGRAHV